MGGYMHRISRWIGSSTRAKRIKRAEGREQLKFYWKWARHNNYESNYYVPVTKCLLQAIASCPRVIGQEQSQVKEPKYFKKWEKKSKKRLTHIVESIWYKQIQSERPAASQYLLAAVQSRQSYGDAVRPMRCKAHTSARHWHSSYVAAQTLADMAAGAGSWADSVGWEGMGAKRKVWGAGTEGDDGGGRERGKYGRGEKFRGIYTSLK